MQKLAAEKAESSTGTGATAAPRVRRRWALPTRRFLVTMALAILGPLVAALVGGYMYFAGGRIVTTDNAYVKADKIAISPVVSGQVLDVAVDADQRVTRGQTLFRIDPEFFELAVEKAEAELAHAKARIEAMRAEYREAMSEMKEAEDRVLFYDAQRARQKQLADKGVGRAFVFEEADSNADAARARVTSARQKMQRVLAQLGGDADIKADVHPLVREKSAARDRARAELAHTIVKAPVSGIVTNFDLQRGEYVSVGRVVFSLVGVEDTWVQANYKETELTHVKVGQIATVHVDTYPDQVWTGRVTSISPATGAEFAILPPQNATGNWVKVVQRLPVRVRLEVQPEAPPLRAGMSVIVDIDTGHQRPAPRWARAALNWAKASP